MGMARANQIVTAGDLDHVELQGLIGMTPTEHSVTVLEFRASEVEAICETPDIYFCFHGTGDAAGAELRQFSAPLA